MCNEIQQVAKEIFDGSQTFFSQRNCIIDEHFRLSQI